VENRLKFALPEGRRQADFLATPIQGNGRSETGPFAPIVMFFADLILPRQRSTTLVGRQSLEP
jgi:hypothetical protein